MITFLRGINVGGHHKVPMSELKALFEELGHKNVQTLLNSGNVISTPKEGAVSSEEGIAEALQQRFKFSVPVVVRSDEEIKNLYNAKPFDGVEVKKSTRLYVTFIWGEKAGEIFSVVDLQDSSTVETMAEIEKKYKKKVTTRNWNTIKRVVSKLD